MHLKFFVICVLGLFLLGASAFAAGPVQAQDNTAANKKTTSSAKSTEKSLRKIITGRVASVNVGKKEISVELKGKKYPISIDGSTTIVGGNNQIALENIKAGDIVFISYQKSLNGGRIALNIDNKTFSASSVNKVSSQEKAKVEPKKDVVAPKTEVKTETKKDAVTPKVEVKAESKTEPAPVPAPAPAPAPPQQAKTPN
jgi:hypothetical protein